MNGMNITATDLVAIIKTCSKSGVETIECGDFKLKFYNNKHHNQTRDIALSQDVISGNDLAFQPHLPTDDVPTDAQLAEDEYFAQLAIENPGLYEELSVRKLMEEGR